MAADAERWAEEGFSTFKLKLGAGEDVAQVRAVREALGPEARIRVDANGAWDVETAQAHAGASSSRSTSSSPSSRSATIEELARAGGLDLDPARRRRERREPRRRRSAPPALGACALAGIKLSKVGGPEEAIAIAEVLPSYLSSALDGPVGIAAAAQVAQTLRRGRDAALAHGLATQRLFSSTSPRSSAS